MGGTPDLGTIPGQDQGSGANANQAKSDGRTALLIACLNGHEACARLLLDRGADANQAQSDGWTALMIACQDGHEACARLLLDRGAHKNTQGAGDETALSLATDPAIRRLLAA